MVTEPVEVPNEAQSPATFAISLLSLDLNIMTIKSDIPQICALRERIENKLGKTLNTHSDFVELTSLIE